MFCARESLGTPIMAQPASMRCASSILGVAGGVLAEAEHPLVVCRDGLACSCMGGERHR